MHKAREALRVSHVIPRRRAPRKKEPYYLRAGFLQKTLEDEMAEWRRIHVLISDAEFNQDNAAAACALHLMGNHFEFRKFVPYTDIKKCELTEFYIRDLKILCLLKNHDWPRPEISERLEWAEYKQTALNPVFLADIALTLLFCLYRYGSLETAKDLVDFMDHRDRKCARSAKLKNILLNSRGGAQALLGYEEDESYWPYNWAPMEDAPALLDYLMAKKSCLLPHALEKAPSFIYKALVCASRQAQEENTDLKTLPGQIYNRIAHLARTSSCYADPARRALAEIDKIKGGQFGKIEEARRELDAEEIQLRKVWVAQPSPS